MRAIQRFSTAAYKEVSGPMPYADDRISILEIKLPKNSRILSVELTSRYYTIWFDGVTDDKIEFDKYKLGIFEPEQPINGPVKFHSRVNQGSMSFSEPVLFFYEFLIP